MKTKELIERLEKLCNNVQYQVFKDLIADLKKPVIYEVRVFYSAERWFAESEAYDIYENEDTRDQVIYSFLLEINSAHRICGLDPITIDNLKIVEK